jgi:pyruvate/2-oxoglutarate dehydrogenase complex dihydrolipoamide acyltransferase (E2) component
MTFGLTHNHTTTHEPSNNSPRKPELTQEEIKNIQENQIQEIQAINARVRQDIIGENGIEFVKKLSNDPKSANDYSLKLLKTFFVILFICYKNHKDQDKEKCKSLLFNHILYLHNFTPTVSVMSALYFRKPKIDIFDTNKTSSQLIDRDFYGSAFDRSPNNIVWNSQQATFTYDEVVNIFGPAFPAKFKNEIILSQFHFLLGKLDNSNKSKLEAYVNTLSQMYLLVKQRNELELALKPASSASAQETASSASAQETASSASGPAPAPASAPASAPDVEDTIADRGSEQPEVKGGKRKNRKSKRKIPARKSKKSNKPQKKKTKRVKR